MLALIAASRHSGRALANHLCARHRVSLSVVDAIALATNRTAAGYRFSLLAAHDGPRFQHQEGGVSYGLGYDSFGGVIPRVPGVA